MNRVAASLIAMAIAMLAAAPAQTAPVPDQSLRPMPRPAGGVAMAGASVTSLILAAPTAATGLVRPRMRPLSPQEIAAATRPEGPFLAPDLSLRPAPRSRAVIEQVLFKKRQRRKNAVCGDLDLQGSPAGDVTGKIKGCYIKDAVRLTSVAGVKLSQPSLMTCDTAKALKKWVDKDVQKAFKRQGPVVELKVAAHYACRTRNNRTGAKLSEHAKGRAIDISAFVMRDGDLVSVLKDWGKGRDGKSLAKAHKAACGPFGTVLGPKSDAYHRDHFHLDTARYRSGAYCR
ncbi:MAG: extensin-like domain-containing protein [Marinibacterium sp.]